MFWSFFSRWQPKAENVSFPCHNGFGLLQGFYGVMKAKDGSIRLGFLTGVTKIGKMSVFSGLNNLNDISMDPEYSDICGISGSDLH